MASTVTITTVAEFPKHTMLENLAVRSDGSVLVVASPQREIWYTPPAQGMLPVEPTLLHTFEDGHLAQCFVEAEPDIFYVATYGKPALYRLDLRVWKPGQQLSPVKVLDFEASAGPNGGALVAPGVLLFSDCLAGSILRVDLSSDGLQGTARTWLQHESMAAGGGHPPVKFSESMEVPFPGINGLRYGPKTKFVYYTTSSQNLFMRVAVDRSTFEPAGKPEHLATMQNVDDLCLDEDQGVAYVARHPDHIIERAPLDPYSSAPGRLVVVGNPFNERLIGPTSVDWGRSPDDYGRVAYATTDGGTVQLPPDGVLRPAKLVRIDFGGAD